MDPASGACLAGVHGGDHLASSLGRSLLCANHKPTDGMGHRWAWRANV